MTLKLIPVEQSPKESNQRGSQQKHFNPGNKIKKKNKDGSLKTLCLRLVHFINRGSKFTYRQIDDLIVDLHQSILSLQKKKQEILERNIQFKKKRIRE